MAVLQRSVVAVVNLPDLLAGTGSSPCACIGGCMTSCGFICV